MRHDNYIMLRGARELRALGRIGQYPNRCTDGLDTRKFDGDATSRMSPRTSRLINAFGIEMRLRYIRSSNAVVVKPSDKQFTS